MIFLRRFENVALLHSFSLLDVWHYVFTVCSVKKEHNINSNSGIYCQYFLFIVSLSNVVHTYTCLWSNQSSVLGQLLKQNHYLGIKMTPGDPERSWLQYIWSPLFQQQLEIQTFFNGAPIGNEYWRSNSRVTNDPKKVKVLIAIQLEPSVSNTAGDRR